jgi:HK97 family phage portal protein
MLQALRSLFTKAVPPIETKANPVGPLIVGYSSLQSVFAPNSYVELSEQGYKHSATVRSVVKRVARAAAELPIKLQRRSAKGEWEDLKGNEDDEHPLMKLMRKPNPTQTKAEFFESVFASRKLAGESFISLVGPTDNQPPLEMWWLRPDRMVCTPDIDGTVKAWTYKTSTGSVVFDMKKGLLKPIVFWKTFNPLDVWRGLSELQSGAMQVCQLNEGAQWNATTLKNSMRPAGAFVYTPPPGTMNPSLAPHQREQLANDINTRLTGSENAAKPMILDGGLTWMEMSISPKDLEWLEGLRDAARTICFLLDYPALMLGIPGDATYKNYNEARMSFYQDSAIPLMTSALDVFNEDLVPIYGEDLRLVVDVDKVEALAELRASTWDRVNNATFLTPNEKRAIVGKPKLDSPLADELWVPTSLVPMDEALAEPEPKLDPEDPDNTDDLETPAKKPKPKPEDKPEKAFDNNLDEVLTKAAKLFKLVGGGK